MATSVTPPPLKGPTAKEKKYDRQLRLWAASGQQALEEAHVLLLNSGSGVVGIETLKNLVLPGIGNFTIVDENVVSEQDLGVNFFLEDESLGKSRAEECCRFLRELNPEVNGISIQKSVRGFISDEPLSKYTLIILVGPMHTEDVLLKISKLASVGSIPLFYVHSVGFYSHFSIQLPTLFPIVDTHPDPVSTQDLRLLSPWPELLEHTRKKTEGLETMSDHEHGHLPYLLLLLHFLDKWKADHGGQFPESYKEKTTFRGIVQAAARTQNAEGGEENFDEAVAAVLKSLNPPTISSGLKELMEEEECKTPGSGSANFWVIAHAINSFITAHGVLPLPGALPDMKSQSTDYIDLQNVYRTKAQKDLARITSSVRKLEAELQREAPIDAKDIEAFCKGAAFTKLVRGRQLRVPDAKGAIDWNGSERLIARELGDDESLMGLYLVLMALDAALDGSVAELSDPASLMKASDDPLVASKVEIFIKGMLENLHGVDPELDSEAAMEKLKKLAEEVQRTGPVELHNISSVTGGLVAQEIIKIITKQYIPVDNTCVFDGITSKAAVYRI